VRRGWLTSLAVLAIVGVLALSPSFSFAQDPPPEGEEAPAKEKTEREKEKEKLEQQRARSVDRATAEKLNKIFDAYNAGKYEEARKLSDGLNMPKLSPYEQSRVYQIQVAIALQEQKYGQARDLIEKAIQTGGLTEQETDSLRFQLVQLFMAEERWKEGIDAWKKWAASATTPPTAAAYYTLAIAYYQSGDLKTALDPAQKAVDMAQKPQESWIQLLLALRIEREEYKLALPLLRRLITMAPAKKNYWVQLAAVNAQMSNFAEAAQSMQLAYYSGLLTEERDLRRLAELLVQIDVPYRAAKILSTAIDKNVFKPDSKTLEFLANCWIQAQEYKKATGPLQAAAEASDSGDLFVRLGQVYSQNEDWSNVATSVRKGIDKGKLKNRGDACLLLGIALYSQKKPEDSIRWFRCALDVESSRKPAEGWLKQIDLERGE
jgi:tetratricopeptide (TPR) repeat protein